MIIKIETENCSFKNPYVIEGLGESSVILSFEFRKLLSVQSRKKFLDDLKDSIQTKLNSFEWLICGKIQIEVHWFLNSVQRQETDKFGDLDNITKPLIDSLSGKSGIFIDDSQINSIHATWTTKNILDNDNLVKIRLNFFNDWTVYKHNLYFLQSSSVVFTPLNFDTTNKDEILGIKIFLNGIKTKRRLAGASKRLGADIDRYFIYSEYEFHRTRLNGFEKNQILTKEDFNNLCFKNGVTLEYILGRLKNIKSN